jgi:arginase
MEAAAVLDRSLRTYHVLGVPLRAGSLTPGGENDARAFREAELLTRLHTAGVRAIDDGDLAIPSYLPHHTVPPIRNWPAPRIVWDLLGEHLAPRLREGDGVPLLIGCDCSVVAGTTQAVMRHSGDGSGSDVHLLYIDGDFDDAAPRPDRCQSAAALALWLATHDSPFRPGPALKPSQVTVIGATAPSAVAANAADAVRLLSLTDVRRSAAAVARQALNNIPASASIVVHLDIDVFQQRELPAAYFPHADGLTLAEGAQLLRVLLPDPRVRVIEVTEYASLRDADLRGARQLVDLLCDALGHVDSAADARLSGRR